MTESELREVIDEIIYKENFKLVLDFDAHPTDPYLNGRPYLQVVCTRPDSSTGVLGVGYGGKVYLSLHMLPGEVVRKAFGAFLAYEEHEAREWFRYQNAQVFGPHISIDALVEIANQKEWRKDARR